MMTPRRSLLMPEHYRTEPRPMVSPCVHTQESTSTSFVEMFPAVQLPVQLAVRSEMYDRRRLTDLTSSVPAELAAKYWTGRPIY